MYAIVQNGGHQVKMVPGTTVLVEDGGEVMTGAPFVANARVVDVVDADTRGPKVRVFKKKKRKGMRRSRGFRHDFTRLRVTSVII